MKKSVWKIFLAGFLVFFCSVFLGVLPSFAAGKAYVQIGEKFEATVENPTKGATVFWNITQKGEVKDKKEGKTLKYSFPNLGEYEINVTTEKDGEIVQSSKLFVVVGEKAPSFVPTLAKIDTVPPLSEDGKIHLSGDKAVVLFSFANSSNFEKFELDSDIFSDANANGVIDDDIENKDSASYFSGAVFRKEYQNTGIPARARVKMYTKDGKMEEKFVNIVFDTNNSKTQLSTKAVLHSIPAADEKGIITLKGTEGTVHFLAQNSEGKIKQYRFDTNLGVDSNGDGVKENDIDNQKDNSFLSGDLFSVAVKKSEAPRDIELLVVDEKGMGSRIRRRIVFSDNISSQTGQILEPLLTASRTKILAGETVIFRLFNTPKDAKISWDFGKDGKMEIENGSETEVEYKFSDAGKQVVEVSIVETGKQALKISKEIEVGGENAGENPDGNVSGDPVAIFSENISDNKVELNSSESRADKNLSNQDLIFSWNFGDGYETTGSNPTHIYEKTGEYEVSLTVEDAAEKKSVFRKTISIQNISHPFDANQHGGKILTEEPQTTETPIATPTETVDGSGKEPNENGEKNLTDGFSLPAWLLLLLLIPFFPLIILIKKKIDEPDKDFSTLIRELLEKLSAPKKLPATIGDLEVSENIAEVLEEKKSVENSSSAVGSVSQNAATPDWMRNYDEEETPKAEENKEIHEIAESSIPQTTVFSEEKNMSLSAGNSGNAENFATPDWMHQTSDSPLSDDLPDAENDAPLQASPFAQNNHPEWLQAIKTQPESFAEEAEKNEEEISTGHGDFVNDLPEIAPDAKIPDWMKPSLAISSSENSEIPENPETSEDVEIPEILEVSHIPENAENEEDAENIENFENPQISEIPEISENTENTDDFSSFQNTQNTAMAQEENFQSDFSAEAIEHLENSENQEISEIPENFTDTISENSAENSFENASLETAENQNLAENITENIPEISEEIGEEKPEEDFPLSFAQNPETPEIPETTENSENVASVEDVENIQNSQNIKNIQTEKTVESFDADDFPLSFENNVESNMEPLPENIPEMAPIQAEENLFVEEEEEIPAINALPPASSQTVSKLPEWLDTGK